MKRILALALVLAGPARAQTPDAALARVFGRGVEVAREFRPATLAADFNGDGVRDLLVVVRRRGTAPLPAAVREVRAWPGEGPSPLGLAILHGARGGWAPRGYLVTGRSFFASPMWQKPEPNLLSVARRRGKAVVVVPTEAAIDTYLYWTGRGYAVEYPEGEVP